MFDVPITFCHDLHTLSEKSRAVTMQEFAVNGAKHLVLTHAVINQLLSNAILSKQYKKEMANAGLSFVDAHAPFAVGNDLNYPDKSFRRQLLHRRRLDLEICADMGVDTITIHTGNDCSYPDVPAQELLDNVDEALDYLLPEAEKLGIIICIENIWCPVNISTTLLEIKKKFPTPALGFCFDSGHANLMEKGMAYEMGAVKERWNLVGREPEWQEDVLAEMLPHVVNCHLHDNIGQWDSHLLPGMGNIDWTHVIPLLKKAPRLKNIQAEVSIAGSGVAIRTLVEKFNELGEL